MADELLLDIIVDDHGAVQKLEDVDKGVEKVKNTADSSKGVLDELGKRFGVNTVKAGEFEAAMGASEVGLSRFSGLIAGVGVGALTLYATLLGQAARKADELTNAAESLGSAAMAARLGQVASAAEDSGVTFERMTGVLGRLQQQLASGAIDGKLRDIGIELGQFKQQNVVEQFLQISDAVGGMADPLDRVNARVKLLGTDTQDMARLMTAGFRESAEGATAMSAETIKAFDDILKSAKSTWSEIKDVAVALVAESTMYFIDPLGRRTMARDALEGAPPTPNAPGKNLPDTLPNQPVGFGRAEMWTEHLELQKQEEENWFRIDEIMRQVAETQQLIVKSGGDWSEVLNTRVAAAVDNINAKYVQAVMLNAQLAGGAQSERDRLMQQLTATTNPNESAFDQRFNEIDQDAKRKMALVDQTDRVSAAEAENAILEEMNLKVLELETNWQKATQSVDGHRKAIEGAGQVMGAGPGGGSPFGAKLPGGLMMPTADQVATGRYFGPVDANGRPDPGRMNGATPMVIHNTINAPNSVNTQGWDELVRQLDQMLATRQHDQGTRTGR
jgi:hypothetical protein